MTSTRHSIARLVGTWAFGLSALGVSVSASASESFPGQVQDHLKLECVPQCTLCHTSNPGRADTWQKGFGLAVASQGVASPDANVAEALEKLRALVLPLGDVDNNGVNDVVQIETNSNPNQNGEDVCGPTYGCGAHVEPQSSFSWGALFAGGFVAVIGLVRVRFGRRKVAKR